MKISGVEALGFPCCHFSAGSVRANAVVFLCFSHVAEQHVFVHCCLQSTRRGWDCSGSLAGREGGMGEGGLRRAALAYVGRLYWLSRRVCRGAAQGVQALECRGAAGKSCCIEEWKSQRMGRKLNGSGIREKYQSKK